MAVDRLGSRKIIQIAVNSSSEKGMAFIVALADDGTLWKTRLVSSSDPQSQDWFAIEGLPEGEQSFEKTSRAYIRDFKL